MTDTKEHWVHVRTDDPNKFRRFLLSDLISGLGLTPWEVEALAAWNMLQPPWLTVIGALVAFRNIIPELRPLALFYQMHDTNMGPEDRPNVAVPRVRVLK